MFVNEDLSFHFAHCKQRAAERYSIALTRDAWNALNRRVFFENDVEFLFQPNGITSIYKVELEGHLMGLMFSEAIDVVTSIIPAEDRRLSGLRPDGTKPKGNFISGERKRRLARAKAQLEALTKGSRS